VATMMPVAMVLLALGLKPYARAIREAKESGLM